MKRVLCCIAVLGVSCAIPVARAQTPDRTWNGQATGPDEYLPDMTPLDKWFKNENWLPMLIPVLNQSALDGTSDVRISYNFADPLHSDHGIKWFVGVINSTGDRTLWVRNNSVLTTLQCAKRSGTGSGLYEVQISEPVAFTTAAKLRVGDPAGAFPPSFAPLDADVSGFKFTLNGQFHLDPNQPIPALVHVTRRFGYGPVTIYATAGEIIAGIHDGTASGFPGTIDCAFAGLCDTHLLEVIETPMRSA